MSCASVGYTGMQAMKAIVGHLTGGRIGHVNLHYPGNHISLGRQDGILQMVDQEARAKPKFMGGRKAARIKAGILKVSLWTSLHPTFCMPKRGRHLAAEQDRPTMDEVPYTLDAPADQAIA